MSNPRGHPAAGTGFWDKHSEIRACAERWLKAKKMTHKEICVALRKRFGDYSEFNTTQISRLKQKLRVTKR